MQGEKTLTICSALEFYTTVTSNARFLEEEPQTATNEALIVVE